MNRYNIDMASATRKRIILALFILLLITGVFFLVIMQTNWASQAAKANKEEVQRNLMMGISSALVKIQDEMEVIYSLLYIEPQDFLDKNWETFYNNVEFLEKDTRFFNFADSLYLLPLANEEQVLMYSREQAVFVPGIPPAYLEDYRTALKKESLWNYIRKLTRHNVNIIPINKELTDIKVPGLKNDEAPFENNPLALMAVEINAGNLFSQELPLYFNEVLGKYAFCIRQAGTVYYTSPEIPNIQKRKPDFLFPLAFPFAAWFSGDVMFIEEKEPLFPPDFSFQAKYPSFRFLLRRRDNREDRLMQLFREMPGDNLMLEVYYPGGPFQAIIARQTFFNEAVSIIILTTLVMSLLFLYRLYTRIQKLREKEQEFVATISHELRTPITVIQATSDNLYQGIINSEEKIRKYGQVIKDQAKRLSLMVENILRYAGLEGGRSFKKNYDSWIDTQIFFQGLLTSLGELAAKKGVRIHYKDDNIKGKIKTDPAALALVLENLLVNAINHGVDAGQPLKEVRLQAKKRVPHGVIFTVEDEGPGIPLREQKKVFTPFYRGVNSIRNQIPGSGLGLHLVKRITELLGGTVTLESPYLCVDGHLQHGCRFMLYFLFEVDDG